MSVVVLKGAREAPRGASSRMETLIINQKMMADWVVPSFQRPLRINDKVRALAEDIKRDGGVIPGILTLGVISGDQRRVHYIVDGQHRIEGAKIAAVAECIADVRIITFKNMTEMAEEFVNLNSAIVRMQPDDILRGLEQSLPALRTVRQGCNFVGYDQVRRGDGSPLIGMSSVLRCWEGTITDVPGIGGKGAQVIATNMTIEDAQQLVVFLNTCVAAWGPETENYRLWGALNLTMCMWIWRRLVLDKDRFGNKHYVVLTPETFKKCLMAVAASAEYNDWLLGRKMGERDRSPCYTRVKTIFAERLKADGTPKVKMMAPSWSHT